MTPQLTHRFAQQLLGIARIELALAAVQHREFSFGLAGVGRFHATVYRQRGSLAMTISRLAFTVPSLADLGVDPAVEAVLTIGGLVLICGHRRRTRLLASLVDRYNATHRGLVVVIEDPLTHLHRDATAIVAQRGVGTDVATFASGIDGARRQGADLIAIGDVPDAATAEAALRAAEEGATVLACVAAPDPNVAATWLVRLYDSTCDQDVKPRLKRLLRAVICVEAQGPARHVMRRQPSLQKAS